MKLRCAAISLLFLSFFAFAQETTDPTTNVLDHFEDAVPQIAIIDIFSSTFDEANIRMFTDVLLTEMFKLNRFRIVERGLIQEIVERERLSLQGQLDDAQLLRVGQLLQTDKLLICRIDRFADTVALNVRVIDIETSVLDFTENIFVTDENRIFDAIRDLVLNIEVRYLNDSSIDDPAGQRRAARQRWLRLGADEEQAQLLVAQNTDINEYLSIRQYDVTFTPTDYIAILDGGWQAQTLIEFFREGIPYSQVQRALGLGIADLENYRTTFQAAGFTFDQYLEAYEANIVSVAEYADFRQGYSRSRYHLGAGGVANSLPIANAEFRFFLLSLAWEYFLTDYQRGPFKTSAETGIFMMNGILPSPYLELNSYFGGRPFYLNLAVGGIAEVFVGGHFGAYFRAGLEVNEAIEFSVITTFIGTQPEVSYTDLSTRRGEEGYDELLFPYIAAVISFKPTRFSPLEF